MKLFLIFTALLAFPGYFMDPVEVEYFLAGKVYYNGVPLKNCEIEYFDFPGHKQTFVADNEGNFKCAIKVITPCPWHRYGTGSNIQKTKLMESVKRANPDSIIFYYKTYVYKSKSMADSVIFNFALNRNEKVDENERKPYQKMTFIKDIFFTGSYK